MFNPTHRAFLGFLTEIEETVKQTKSGPNTNLGRLLKTASEKNSPSLSPERLDVHGSLKALNDLTAALQRISDPEDPIELRKIQNAFRGVSDPISRAVKPLSDREAMTNYLEQQFSKAIVDLTSSFTSHDVDNLSKLRDIIRSMESKLNFDPSRSAAHSSGSLQHIIDNLQKPTNQPPAQNFQFLQPNRAMRVPSPSLLFRPDFFLVNFRMGLSELIASYFTAHFWWNNQDAKTPVDYSNAFDVNLHL